MLKVGSCFTEFAVDATRSAEGDARSVSEPAVFIVVSTQYFVLCLLRGKTDHRRKLALHVNVATPDVVLAIQEHYDRLIA